MRASTRIPVAGLVRAWLEERQGAMEELLVRLVEAESPSLAPVAQATVRELLAGELRRLDFRVRVIPGAPAGPHMLVYPHARVRGAVNQLLVGHLDTVWPVGTIATMPVTRRAGRITGPGAYDMKGGLVQGIFALASLRALGLRPEVTPVVFISSDEEIGSPSSARWIRRLARSAVRAFILEPSFGLRGALKTSRKGVGQFTLRIRGRAAHAGINPEAGVSAIRELAYQVQRLFELNDSGRGVTVNVGTIDGGLRPNVIAPDASAVIDVRVPTIAEGLRVEQAIRSLSPTDPAITLTVTGGIDRPPMEATARNQALWRAAQRCARALGLDLEQASVGGASDGNLTSLDTATLDGLGAVGDGAHAADEYVACDRMVDRAALLAMLLSMPQECDG
jgi:glutamate carboxypeptidase